MKRIPPIKSVMTPFPFWIGIDESLDKAKKMMDEHAIHHLPVKKDGELVGVLSDRDIQTVLLDKDTQAKTVADVCVLEVYTVDMQEPLDNVLWHLYHDHIGSALVLKNGRLAGLFTTNDACRCFADMLRDQFRPSGGGDAA